MVIFKNLFQYTAVVIVLQDRPSNFYIFITKLFLQQEKGEVMAKWKI